MLLPWWRAQRRARRQAINLQCAAIDQEIGSQLDARDRLDRIRNGLVRWRDSAEYVKETHKDKRFGEGAEWAFTRMTELFDEY